MTENAYLVGLRLAGKKVVVVGGGSVAQRRMPAAARQRRRRPRHHPGGDARGRGVPERDGITLELRDFRDGDLDGAWYAIAATDDPAVNAAVVAEAERRGIFCVRADVARDGTAVTPASFEYDGLSVGVLAGGEHRRSAAIRSAIHEALQSGVITDEVPDASARRRRAGRRRTRRPRADHRARPAAAGAGRRRRRRPAGPAGTAGRTGAPRRGDRRREDPVRPRDGPGRDQRRADRPGQGGQVRRAAQGR